MKRKLSIKQRLQEPTPRFFKKVLRVGLVIGGIGAAILGAPVSLPAAILTAGGYMVAAGTVATVISKTVSVNENNIE